MVEDTLRSRPFEAGHILVTGANGYVGSLVVASLLRDTAARITCLVRAGHGRAAVLAPIVHEWQQQSHGLWSAAVERRLTVRELPQDLSDLPGLAPQLAGVDEIVHCAGCVDYHDTARLRAANLSFTVHLLALARRLAPARFVYISSAFAGGLRSSALPEGPLDEPAEDPTPYTRSKRQAERLVARAGVPFLVLRPSILIGHSRSGHYSGKRYGLVQQWASLEQLLGARPPAEAHVVATDARLNLLHQDMFCAAFKAARRWLPDGAYMNLVSREASLPTLNALWDLWFEVMPPLRVQRYASVAEIPLRRIDLRQRTYLTFARVSLQIAAHPWHYDAGWLDRLGQRGLHFEPATLASVRRCQDQFVAASPLLRARRPQALAA